MMRTFMKLFILILLLLASSASSWSSPPPGSIMGLSTVSANQSTNYSYNPGIFYETYSWNVVGGTVQSEYAELGIYYATILWTTPGSGSLTFLNDVGDPVATKSITINPPCTPPGNPSVIFAISPSTCPPRTLSYTGTPTSEITWYWQTTSSGTSMSNSSNTYSVSANGTYYVRAYNNSTGCWSAGTASYAATVSATPGTPSSPTISTNTCGAKTITKGTAPTGVTWYWQGTDLNGTDYTSPSATASTYTVNVTGTYYLRARNNASPNCWSTSSRSVSVTISPAQATATVSSNTCGTVTITRGNPTGTDTWYWQGTSATGTSTSNLSQTYSVSASGTYYLRSRTSGGCWSPTSTAIPVTYNAEPATPPVFTVSTNTCGDKVLTKPTAPGGVTFFWQGTNASGTDYTSATAIASTYTASTHGTQTYYLRARYNTSPNCWSASSRGISVDVNKPAAPSNASFTYCESESMGLTTTNIVGSLRWYSSNNTWLATGTTYTPVDLDNGNYSYMVRNSVGSCEGLTSGTVTLQVGKPECDSYLNWNESIGYGINPDGSSKEIASAKSYEDGFGNPFQSQVKSYATNQIFATQGIYDSNGQIAASTLPAPINSNVFQYRHRFATNNTGQHYSASDFDNSTQTGAVGELNNPKPVGNNGVGSLGWYYSSSNTLEPQTATSNFPYSRTWAEQTPNPKKSISAGPGDAYRMGANHEAITEQLTFTKGELGHYFSLQNYFVPSTLSNEINLIGNSEANSTSGFSSNQSVTISSVTQNNQSYVKVISNQSSSTPGIWPIENTKVVVPGQTYKFRLKGYRVTSGSNVFLYVKNATTDTNFIWPGALLPQGSANEAWIETSFTVPTGCTSISLGVLFSGPPATGDSFFINALSFAQVINENNVVYGYKILSTDPDKKQTMSFVDADGKELASALVTSVSGTAPNQTFTYDYWNYTYYNDLGQVVGSVAPNGVNTSSSANPTFATRYKYDHMGRLIETTSTDEGTSQFVYSNDGKIRFSQNQEQRNATPKRFSYTNYDYLGRLIESGEYKEELNVAGTSPYLFEPLTTLTPASSSVLLIAEAKGYTGVTRRKNNATASRYSDSTFIDYDFVMPDFVSDTYQPVQNNLRGQVSRTKNGNASTWYSYDEFGQLEWTKQFIDGLGYKTVNYTYDYLGNVTEVAYQKGVENADVFYHHYTYDSDQRLSEVYTSSDGVPETVHAKYKYYLHGPLKRVELAENKQGVDYAYTINGSLKGINHADGSLDPGQDGIAGANASFAKDVFGMNMHYYSNDYSSRSMPINALSTSAPLFDQFGGNLKAITYNSPIDLNKKNIYGFQYDAVNQMTNAQWGTFSASSGIYETGEAQREQIPGYDKNGNIQSLIRKGKEQAVIETTANYNYVYEANTNKLDKVNHNAVPLTDYTYNAIGQMISQVEDGNTMNVSYTAYGLVKEVRNGSNQLLVSYYYDDRGDVVKKAYYNEGILVKNVFYVNDASGSLMALYEQTLPSGTIQLAEIPIYGSGRVALHKPTAYPDVYFYEIGDHLGNVRAVIGVPEAESYTATMESEVSEEMPFKPFKNISNTRAIYNNANKTPGGNESARLNNAKPAGPAISFEVSPGDVINMNAWAYYEGGSSNFSSSITETSMLTAIAAAFGGVSGAAGEAGQIFNNVNNGFAGILGSSGSSTVPSAFLTYVVYDKNFKYQYFGSVGVTENANGNLSKEHLVQQERVIDAPGYIYICLYNRSDNVNPVYFDDLTVSITHSPIVAGADYYPFGLPQDGREITDEFYRFGYQGQYNERDTVTGWNEFELRMYDPRFGRWLSVDSYGQFASPYVGMGNAPHLGVDPDGGFWIPSAELMETIGSLATYLDGITVTAARSLGEGAILGKVGDVGIRLSLSNTLRFSEGVGGPPHEIGTNYKLVEDKNQTYRSLEIRPSRKISTAALYPPSTPNPLIGTASGVVSSFEVGTSITLGQIAKSPYWRPALFGAKIFAKSITFAGAGLTAYQLADEWKTGNFASHSIANFVVTGAAIGVGAAAVTIGSVPLMVGVSVVGLGYQIAGVAGLDQAIDREFNPIIMPYIEKMRIRIHGRK